MSADTKVEDVVVLPTSAFVCGTLNYEGSGASGPGQLLKTHSPAACASLPAAFDPLSDALGNNSADQLGGAWAGGWVCCSAACLLPYMARGPLCQPSDMQAYRCLPCSVLCVQEVLRTPMRTKESTFECSSATARRA